MPAQPSELINCPECGQLFTRVSRPVCPDCWEKQEFEVRLCQQWMKLNPGFELHEVSEAVDVPIEQIIIYVNQRRLLVEKSKLRNFSKCEACSAVIVSGSLCRSCMSQRMASEALESHQQQQHFARDEGHASSDGDDGSSLIHKYRRH